MSRKKYTLVQRNELTPTTLKNRHVTRFGSAVSNPRALYSVFDQQGLIGMEIDLEIEKFRNKGVLITPEIRTNIRNEVKERKKIYDHAVNGIGVPEKFTKLFSLNKKAQVEQYSREVIISEYELFLLIHNCSQIPFTHRFKFKQYIPQHLRVTEADRSEMDERFLRKTDSQLIERRIIHAHLFEFSSVWHCFYFSDEDTEPGDSNHWKNGCHIHYINYLWPLIQKTAIWDQFNTRSTDIPGLHIKFEPFILPEIDEKQDGRLRSISSRPPWSVTYDSNLAAGCGSVPLPVPQVATRGTWFATVAFPLPP